MTPERALQMKTVLMRFLYYVEDLERHSLCSDRDELKRLSRIWSFNSASLQPYRENVESLFLRTRAVQLEKESINLVKILNEIIYAHELLGIDHSALDAERNRIKKVLKDRSSASNLRIVDRSGDEIYTGYEILDSWMNEMTAHADLHNNKKSLAGRMSKNSMFIYSAPYVFMVADIALFTRDIVLGGFEYEDKDLNKILILDSDELLRVKDMLEQSNWKYSYK